MAGAHIADPTAPEDLRQEDRLLGELVLPGGNPRGPSVMRLIATFRGQHPLSCGSQGQMGTDLACAAPGGTCVWGPSFSWDLGVGLDQPPLPRPE